MLKWNTKQWTAFGMIIHGFALMASVVYLHGEWCYNQGQKDFSNAMLKGIDKMAKDFETKEEKAE